MITSVCAYCRVSTDHEDQANSFASQKLFFREYIQGRPHWELYRIYADEGITGTNTKKRRGFHQMIQDAYEGKFQKILTKEVSRFSRNIVDTMLYTRELKAIGVTVLFLTENIDTSDPKSEMLLSFMATLAQEESRKTGCRVTWGQQRQMEKGVVFGHSLLGYDLIDGKLRINPEGAEIVRLIFHKYTLEKMSAEKIARYLKEKGIKTTTGNSNWHASYILKILKNEKYVGDLVQRKSYTPDYLTHQKKTNHGEVPLIQIQNHHEPIIEKELWELTQNYLKKSNKHNQQKGGHSNRYAFSGKIQCSVCGASFVSRVKKRKDGTAVRYWGCATAITKGLSGCKIGIQLRDEDGWYMMRIAIQSLQLDREQLVEKLGTLIRKEISGKCHDMTGNSGRLRYRIEKLLQKKERVMDAYFSGDIKKEDMQRMIDRYEQEMLCLQEESSSDFIAVNQDYSTILEKILKGEIESELFCKRILDKITVFPGRKLEMTFQHLPLVFIFGES